MRLKTCTQAVVIALSLGTMATAGASGFQLLEQNASGLGNAYAGSAAIAEDASTVFYNPAGMTRLQQTEISVGGAYIMPSFKFKNTNSSSDNLTNTGSGGDAGASALAPNAYATMALGNNLVFGLGAGAPFGLKTEYETPWIGAAQSVSFEIITKNLNPSLAWKIDPTWSVGAGVNAQTMSATYLRIAGTTYGATTTATFDADDTAYGWNAGILFTPNKDTRLGVSYRSKVHHEVTGTLSFAGSLAGSAATGGLTTNGNAKANVTLPDTAILSLAQTINSQWEALADVSWTGWSSIPSVDLIRTSGALAGTTAQSLETDFRDAWRVALGGNYTVSDSWKIRFGTAWDQTPVKNAEKRLVSLPDNDRVWLSAGVQWKPVKDSRIDLGAAYLIIGDATINNNQSSSSRGLVNGSYDGSIYIVGLQYSQAF